MRRPSKKTKITLTDSSRGISFHPSSNNTPSSPPSCLGSKIKALPEQKHDDELPAGIGYDYYFSPLVIDGDFKMGYVSGGNCSMNNNTLSQKDCDSNNSDVSSGNSFINRHTISQHGNSSNFKEMDRDVEKGDLSSGYGSMNSQTAYQQNGLK